MRIYSLLSVFFVLILCSCQPSSLEEFQMEGLAHAKLLLEDLRGIEERKDLVRVEPVLKKRFERLVDVMVMARAFEQKKPNLEGSLLRDNFTVSDLLKEEMQRVYSIEGGRECIERAQKEAMLRLDAKERYLSKNKSMPSGSGR
jgi:hypothetical protein